MSMESHNQAAAREARRFLADRVRNDWSFPDTPQAWDSSGDELHQVSQYRERFYGSTDDDTVTEDEEEHLEAASPREEKDAAVADTTTTTTAGSEDRRQQQRHLNDTTKFRFEHPDGVADEMVDRALRRKRRRRRRLLAEMQWNEGLANFIAQRDAWTGATAARKHLRCKASDVAAAAAATTTTTTTTSNGSPTTATSPSSSSTTAPLERATQETLHLHNLAASDDDTDYEPPLPIAPRILPHNPIRDSITPRSYPDIYSKIVLQSQTPKVPINLKDMTTALVSGWKADGEWPPKPSPADPLVGAARSSKTGGRTGVVGGGVGKVAAVLTGGLGVGGGGGGGGGGSGAGGITGAAEKRGLNAHAAAVSKSPTTSHHHHHEFLSHHPHVKRGVESVRKVFRLSGSGGSHNDQGASPAA
ncbi:hypothetical protein IWX90DRAFT_166444 [Phyllosticta citrichinensis]|uniref:Gag1-like clamp domain-containing protein n=1 Tax=Phyllosticta citrichinensis TaxID=1130410 RepID=A0ABR1Y0S4_9PEZI